MTRRLSPFFLGPVPLYDGLVAKNVENAWQYSKVPPLEGQCWSCDGLTLTRRTHVSVVQVYKQHTDPVTGEPTAEYWAWAKEGWANPKPVRFPMGRGAKPEYSYWEGKKYGYVAARKKIYCPLYASLVRSGWAPRLPSQHDAH